MDYTEVINIISNIGFPIAVAVYMMVHNTKIVKDNTATTEKNTETLNSLKELINNLMMKIG